jgi:hypothetical protein
MNRTPCVAVDLSAERTVAGISCNLRSKKLFYIIKPIKIKHIKIYHIIKLFDTKKFKTEEEKKHAESVRKSVLQHCVACHQQLDLLQLRLINFEDLVNGVQDTIQLTNKQLLKNQTASF